MPFLIGIDVGTTNVKAVLFNLKGEEVKIATRKNEPLYLGNSKVEQEMDLLWIKVRDCLKEIMDSVDSTAVKGIGVTGQGEGCWLVDSCDRPISNAILWNDGRAKELVDNIVADNSLYQTIYEHTGTPPLTGTALTLLLWSKENRPDELEKASRIMFAKDWIRFKLVGEHGLEQSDAGTSLLDIETVEFDNALFDKVGLSEYKHLVDNQIHKSNEIAGYTTRLIQKETGIYEGTPVSFGAIDVVATTMGVGAIHKGDICTILGTTCATNIVMDSIEPGKANTRFEKHMIDDLYIDLKPTMSGTTNIDWLFQTIAKGLSFAEVDKQLLSLPASPSGVIYHPYLSTSGERSPFYHSKARSSFFGVNQETKRIDLIKSVYEGIAFSIRDCLQYSEISEESVIFLAGGGAASRAWKQIIANVTHLPVIDLDGSEFAAKGVVMGLAVTLGIFENYEDAAIGMTHANKIYQPEQKMAEEYDAFYELYLYLRKEFVPLWEKRAEILSLVGRGE